MQPQTQLTPQQLEKIMETCEKMLAENPKNGAVHHDMGSALMQLGRFQEAEGYFETAKELEPRLASAWYLCGVCLGEQGRFDEAIDHWKKTVELDRNHCDAIYFLGKTYGMKGMWDMAIHQFNRAIRLRENVPLYHLGLAEMQLAKADFTAARKEWEFVLEIDEKNVTALSNLSAVAMEEHDWERALMIGKRAIECGATNALVFFNMGMACIAIGASDLAVQYLEEACLADDEDLSNHLALGEAYVTKGELQKGIDKWEYILSKDPQNTDALYNLGLVHMQNLMTEKGKAYLEQVLAINPAYLPARANLGIYHYQREELETSLAIWEEILKYDPRHQQSLGNIVEIFLRQEEFGSAEQRLGHALDIYPNDARFHFLKGWLAWEKGNISQVLPEWRFAKQNAVDVFTAYAPRLSLLLQNNGYEKLVQVASSGDVALLEELSDILQGKSDEKAQVAARAATSERRSLLNRIRDIFKG